MGGSHDSRARGCSRCLLLCCHGISSHVGGVVLDPKHGRLGIHLSTTVGWKCCKQRLSCCADHADWATSIITRSSRTNTVNIITIVVVIIIAITAIKTLSHSLPVRKSHSLR